jgi:hypothetical protein
MPASGDASLAILIKMTRSARTHLGLDLSMGWISTYGQ